MATFLDEVKEYVGFGSCDSAALRHFLGPADPYLPAIASRFYQRIERHPRVSGLLEGPAQVARLEATLVEWMRSGLEGPHDQTFLASRKRIGHAHVRINLPQQYMLTALSGVRLELREVAEEAYRDHPASRRRVSAALDKLLDIELALMIDTYREASEARLRRRERLAAVGEFAASVAHDLRNPLGVIQSSIFLIQKRGGLDDALGRYVRNIAEQASVCTAIIGDLLEMVRNRKACPDQVPAAELLGEALARTALPPNISVEQDLEAGLEVRAERGIMAQALSNLIGNAALAYESRGGVVTVRAWRHGGEQIIEILDRGKGFDPDLLPYVFEALVTTRQQGFGIGLALVSNIVERHGGRVEAENRKEGGAVVRIVLPRAGAE